MSSSCLTFGEHDYWWSADQPNEITSSTTSPASTTEMARGTASGPPTHATPTSANYSPANFNRVARAFAVDGQHTPAIVEEHGRRLNTRSKMISAWEKQHDADEGRRSIPAI